MARTRIALLGGSFNPPHVGHQMIALWILSTEQADQVWLVPCSQHPFGKQLAAFEHRVQMCRLAARDFPERSVIVSDVEESLGGGGRTLITIQHLLREHPDHRFSLVIGSDILKEKDAWYRFDEIEALVDVVVVGRSGHEDAAPPGSPVLPAISSSEIRRRIARGEEVSHQVPAPVLDYIRAHNLYRMDG
jgi:nicotinate-nucleotide adenylyltransferase